MPLDGTREYSSEYQCRLVGCSGVANCGERQVLSVLVACYRDRPDVTLYCEPSLARGKCHLPDIVVVDPLSGVHVVEVKGVPLENVTAVNAGEITISRNGRRDRRCPLNQARQAMFEIKHDTERNLGASSRIPFLYWLVFTAFSRQDWEGKWGEHAFSTPEMLFSDDLQPERVQQQLDQASRNALSGLGIDRPALNDLSAVYGAFGDSNVLFGPLQPCARRREGTLGEYCREAATDDTKQLSDEQQSLAAERWEGHPHVVRGVAGSGKTVVLAVNLARLVQRWRDPDSFHFENPGRPKRVLVVCYNRALAPFVLEKIRQAFRQRTNESEIPPGAVAVHHVNGLMYELSHQGLWEYQSAPRPRDKDASGSDARARSEANAQYYLARLDEAVASRFPALDNLMYDAIYVDEGQDLLEDEFRLLVRLCRKDELTGEPSLFIFYDDAQNLYGRRRPVWDKLGIKVKGYSDVMKECHRNTKQIIGPALNLLLGAPTESVKMRGFAETRDLEEAGVLEHLPEGYWDVRFAKREGPWPEVFLFRNVEAENQAVLERLRWLLEEEVVPPEEILVLGPEKRRLQQIGRAIRRELKLDVVIPFQADEKDKCIFREGCLTVSTIHTAKGYDACCVLLLSANDLGNDVRGRVGFYVGSTRARDHLDVFSTSETGLVKEFSEIVQALRERSAR
jgi:hypothetical protein